MFQDSLICKQNIGFTAASGSLIVTASNRDKRIKKKVPKPIMCPYDKDVVCMGLDGVSHCKNKKKCKDD
jgi:hypothetical protein